MLRNCRSKYISLVSMSALVVAIGLLLTYALPHVLPAGTTPAATPAPTPTPTPTPPPMRTVPLRGRLEDTGILRGDVQVISQDGLAVLTLPRGTKVLDAQGQPPMSVTVTTRELPVATDVSFVGLAYEFGPEGATLDPPASLTISYDAHAYYPFSFQDADTRQVYMACLDEKGSLGPAFASVDSGTASITAKIDHLGTFIPFCGGTGVGPRPQGDHGWPGH